MQLGDLQVFLTLGLLLPNDVRNFGSYMHAGIVGVWENVRLYAFLGAFPVFTRGLTHDLGVAGVHNSRAIPEERPLESLS